MVLNQLERMDLERAIFSMVRLLLSDPPKNSMISLIHKIVVDTAIRFVLSDSLTNLRAEERQNLLFEGRGKHVFSAYVHIHFDNSDRRFPVGPPDLHSPLLYLPNS